jgi:hypothetical protein
MYVRQKGQIEESGERSVYPPNPQVQLEVRQVVLLL